ncbi:peroxisome biogenesis factor 2-like [Haliotis rufescens]|uniref:peroxisome biogenesis factor 2-like n=1 Tax=Haliotis rufescens TaxID=6454 RepID=UPI00201F2483|nr:peroxisome biogenesis factor 2-like [Haliotis rufescens]
MAENVDGRVPALRVSQLDAAELDQEVVQLTKTQLNKIFKYHQSSFLTAYDPEINALLKFVLWKFSIHQWDASIGQQILNIRYGSNKAPQAWMSSRQKWLYALILIGCPWLRDRSHDLVRLLRLENWEDRIEKYLQWAETTLKVAALVNFLMFLRRGGYLSVVERILGVQSMFPQRQGLRQVSFEYMTRELLWHGFSEFLFFALPLVNLQRIKNTVVRWTFPRRTTQHPLVERSRHHLTSCGVCGEWPVDPQEIGCVHVFCYYCIHSNYKADPGLTCPLCNKDIPDRDSIQSVRLRIQPQS